MARIVGVDIPKDKRAIIALTGGTLRVGPFHMTWDGPNEVLRGVLPTAFVPVFSIPFELRRSAVATPGTRQAKTRPEVEMASPAWTISRIW